MAKNPNGFTKGAGNLEWGSKARKEEDHLHGARSKAAREAIQTGFEELVTVGVIEDTYDVYMSELEEDENA